MHVIERGPRDGIPLVMLHGVGVDHRLLLPLDGALEAAAGPWRRLYVDLPGHGASPGDDVASADDVVGAVEAEIEDQLGSAPFAILGNSFGGQIARAVAHRRPASTLGLATLVGVVEARHDRRDVPERALLARDPRAVAALGEAGPGYEEMAVEQSEAGARAYAEYVLPGLESADQRAMERIAADYAIEPPPEASSGAFEAPALMITGRQDQVVGYRDAWASLEHYPRATFAVLDAAGHNAHLDRPSLVQALVLDWLERVRTHAGRVPGPDRGDVR